jgi:hypothetical protein
VKLLIVLLIAAAVVGGLIGGEVSGKPFSVLGATVGGVGLGVILLSLGAFFTLRDEKRKKETLPSEMREVFDRMFRGSTVGTGDSKLSGKWRPRLFHENKSRADIAEWFAHVDPWTRVDPRLIQVLIDRLYGSPMFELFVHASQDCQLIQQYVPLRSLFEKDITVAACPSVAGILTTSGAAQAYAFAKLMESANPDRARLQTLYSNALNACEAAIHVEPLFMEAYLHLAHLRRMLGKTEEAIKLCAEGLAQAAKLKQSPLHLSHLPEINSLKGVREVETQLTVLLLDLQTSAKDG